MLCPVLLANQTVPYLQLGFLYIIFSQAGSKLNIALHWDRLAHSLLPSSQSCYHL